MQAALRSAFPAMLLAVALVLAACGGNDATESEERAGSASIQPTAPASVARGSPSTAVEAPATPAALLSPAVGVVLERVVVQRVKVDAPVEVKGVNARGEMEDPSGKDAVAWYDFSGFPGFGGNAVFSGHVDWFTGELGPFGRIKELRDGDEIVLAFSDGMEMKYQVVSTTTYEVTKAPVAEIVGPTERDSLTFITCEGTFDRSARDYSHRRIVRAERVS